LRKAAYFERVRRDVSVMALAVEELEYGNLLVCNSTETSPCYNPFEVEQKTNSRWRTQIMLPEDFYKKNLEMWEKFTTSYMDTMFKTVEKTLEQSKVFKDRVDKAVASAMESQMDVTMSSLEMLQRQLETLNAKVDELIEKQSAD
jgi:hypothetical protein